MFLQSPNVGPPALDSVKQVVREIRSIVGGKICQQQRPILSCSKVATNHLGLFKFKLNSKKKKSCEVNASVPYTLACFKYAVASCGQWLAYRIAHLHKKAESSVGNSGWNRKELPTRCVTQAQELGSRSMISQCKY